ncbi:MAG: hypothetical protein K6G15_10105 [Desulfovibrio sp.]|nr:hypothetical protein [Desulfovibrio sp.]
MTEPSPEPLLRPILAMSACQSFLALCRKLFAFSLLSRLLGLVRDLAIAWLVGVGPAADLLAQALRLPHIFRRLLAEGSLSLALTSAFVRHGQQQGRALFRALHRRLFCFLTLLLALALLFSQPLAALLSANAQQAEQLVPLLALALPYCVFAGMAALSMSYLHARGFFTLPACSPLVFNGIVLLMLLPACLWSDRAVALIVLGMSLAGFGQWLWQTWPLRRYCQVKNQNTTPSCSSQARQILSTVPPSLFAAAAPHLAMLCAMIFLAGYGPGQVSAFFYAERLLELPLGLIGVCLGMASLPSLSLAASRKHFGRFARKLSRALHMTVLLILPAMTGLWSLAFALTSLLFGHGHFAADDLPRVAEMLILLLPLLPVQAVGRVLLAACTALGGERVACLNTLLALIVLLALSLCAVHPAQAVIFGLAGHAAILWLWLARSLKQQRARLRFAPAFLLSALLCALLCGCCAKGLLCLAAALGASPAVQVLCAMLAGLAAWLVALRLLRKRDFVRLQTLLRQKCRSEKN